MKVEIVQKFFHNRDERVNFKEIYRYTRYNKSRILHSCNIDESQISFKLHQRYYTIIALSSLYIPITIRIFRSNSDNSFTLYGSPIKQYPLIISTFNETTSLVISIQSSYIPNGICKSNRVNPMVKQYRGTQRRRQIFHSEQTDVRIATREREKKKLIEKQFRTKRERERRIVAVKSIPVYYQWSWNFATSVDFFCVSIGRNFGVMPAYGQAHYGQTQQLVEWTI